MGLVSRIFVGSFFACIALLAAPSSLPQNEGTPQDTNSTPHAFSKATIVYVSDFELDAEDVKVDKGGVVGQARPGIFERPRKKEQRDPEAQAKRLVDLMSKSLVEDLERAGYRAQRLAPGEPRPASGAWVHGVFTEVDEGSQRRRAVFGFGSGAEKMDLYVTLTDLSKPEKPLYDAPKEDKSDKKMGAAITMNPYVAAAKYVMEKNASEKTVKKAAKEISEQVAKNLE
jgi:hypothetical protein